MNWKKMCCRILVFIVFLVGGMVLLILHFPQISTLARADEFHAWLSNQGIRGPLAILGIQILQIVIALIPGEPIELLAGALYGPVAGTVICLIGCVLASSLIFTLTNKFGKRFLDRLFTPQKVDQWHWLQENRRIETVTFLLFLIPGTPKDLLTYIAGITDITLGKFLCISTFARIPSILLSTLIGSSARRGDWSITLAVFCITGVVGLLGVRGKDTLLAAFCHTGRKESKAEPLDLVELSHVGRLSPLLYCHMTILGHLDIDRLKHAVILSAEYVPEILCAYDRSRRCFHSYGFDADQVILLDCPAFDNNPQWDLFHDTQLKISIQRQETKDILLIAMSHLVSDGEGLKQYLYLLATLYQGKRPMAICNQRTLPSFFKNAQVQPPTQQTKHFKKILTGPLLPLSAEKQFFCLNSTIPAAELHSLCAKAKDHNATLNDVFMTAYVRTIARFLDTEQVAIPCPADLRGLTSLPHAAMTVANMTGLCRTIVAEIPPDHTFASTLMQIRLEMRLQKSRRRCLAGIPQLLCIHPILPTALLNWTIRVAYPFPSVAYTNLGVIDSGRLAFSACQIEDCYFTGSYREAPHYQLTISTFRSVCYLNCTIVGGIVGRDRGQAILDSVKKELLDWLHE